MAKFRVALATLREWFKAAYWSWQSGLLNVLIAIGGGVLVSRYFDDRNLGMLFAALIVVSSASIRLAYLLVRHGASYLPSTHVAIEIIRHELRLDAPNRASIVLTPKISLSIDSPCRCHVWIVPDPRRPDANASLVPIQQAPALLTNHLPVELLCEPVEIPVQYNSDNGVRSTGFYVLTSMLAMDTDPPTFITHRRITTKLDIRFTIHPVRGASITCDAVASEDRILW